MNIQAIFFFLLLTSPLTAQNIELEYRSSPLDNPVRGLVPYASQMPWLDPYATEIERVDYFKKYNAGVFPHSMEFNYFSMRELMPEQGKVDFAPIEKWLQQATSRGCQLTFRIYLEYPTNPDQGPGVPQFLVDQGLKVTKWKNEDQQTIHTPDYNDPKLREAIDLLIQRLGEQYDGDPRVACLTMGFLGHWGEWHSYPRGELFPEKKYQLHVMDQFEKAFKQTPILMRYASGDDDWSQAPNANRPFGFHDDSFAWATIATEKEDENWFFLAKMKAAGALDAWKTRMIGGEIRPELWGCIFDHDSCEKKGQKFVPCVEKTHATWLMDSGMFGNNDKASESRLAIAKTKVGYLGYEYFIPNASIESKDGKTTVELKIDNRGVAPFYFNWKVEVAVLDAEGNVRASVFEDWNLPSILPSKPGAESPAISRSTTLDSELKKGEVVGIRIPNPMEAGKPLRFANRTQQLEGEQWMLLNPVWKSSDQK
jgi:hypothetical protein